MSKSTYKKNYFYKAVLTVTVILAVCAALFIMAGQTSSAATKALTVQLNGVTKKTYTVAQLKKLSTSKKYNYSAWNTYPSYSTSGKVTGPTVEAILKDAGVYKKVKDNGTVSFNSGGYQMALTGSQLFKEKRYYFPNGNLVEHEIGYIPEDSYEGKVKVPAVISLEESGCLYIGQVAPNEENKPLFVHEMADGGIINVSTAKAAKCEPIVISAKNGSLQKQGTELVISNKEGSKNSYEYDKIYFTFDKKVSPNYGCAIYNCGPKQDLEHRPILSQRGKLTLKVRVKGYGKLDSTLQTFTFYVGDALTVKINGQVAKAYETVEDVKKAGTNVTCNYSGYNTYPTWSTKTGRSGVKIEDILRNAGISDFGRGTITFTTGADEYSTTFTMQQFFSKRYYYPNGDKGTDNQGSAATAASYEGKSEVPAIIETADANTLEFGQIAPNEQNFAECVDNMFTLGVIEVQTAGAEKCSAVGASTPTNGATVEVGQKIKLPYPTKANKRVRIHYIVDPAEGELPTEGCAIYNYAPNRWSEKLVNAPVFTTTGTHTIVARNISYGKADGDVTTYTFNVVLAKPSIKLKAGKKQMKVSWKKIDGAVGYEVYQSTKKSSGYQRVALIGDANTVAYTIKGLKSGKTYYYKVRACEDESELKYGNYSAVKSAKAK